MVWHASNDVEIDAAFCPLEEIVFYAPITISLTTLMSISINRYVIVCHNKIYDSVYSNYKVILKIALIWFLGIGILILPAFGVMGEFRLDETKYGCEWEGDSSKMVFTVLFTLLPLVIMIFCYSMIYLKIRQGFFNFFFLRLQKVNFIPKVFTYLDILDIKKIQKSWVVSF